jgi:hypothetical protein
MAYKVSLPYFRNTNAMKNAGIGIKMPLKIWHFTCFIDFSINFCYYKRKNRDFIIFLPK